MIATNYTPGLVSGATNGLKDIKPPVEIPNGWQWVWWTVAALALATLFFALWKWWKARRSRVPVIPPVPPHVRARQRLQEALSLLGSPREFCIAVSDVIRFYLEERFNLRAPERTTEEFLYELQSSGLLTDPQKASLAAFLQRCDLVKFARYEPAEPELRDLHAAALKLVEETEPVPPPAASAAQPPPALTDQNAPPSVPPPVTSA